MTQATISNWSIKVLNNASPQVLTAIEEAFSVSGLGAVNELIDVTNFDSPSGSKEYISGLADGEEFTVEANYIPGATGQENVMTAVDNQQSRSAELAYTGVSPQKTFSCTVVCLGWVVVPSPTEQNTIQFTFKISGNITRA